MSIRLPSGTEPERVPADPNFFLSKNGDPDLALNEPHWGFLETAAWVATADFALVSGIIFEMSHPDDDHCRKAEYWIHEEVRSLYCKCMFQGSPSCRCFKATQTELVRRCQGGEIAGLGRHGHSKEFSPIPAIRWINATLLFKHGQHLTTYGLENELADESTWHDVQFSRGNVLSLWPSSSAQSEKAEGRRGRTKGSGSLEAADAPLLTEMRTLIAEGKAFSPDGAAKMIAHKAKGGGTESSKATRLANRYRESEKK